MPMEKISSFSDYDLHATHSSDHITTNGSVYAGNFKISSSDQNFGERFSRKNSSKRHSSCPIDFMESVDHIIEPADYMKVSQFTLDYIEVEGSYKPRFGGYQTLVEREHSFYARNSTVHCGFIKGPSGFPSTGFNLNKKDKDYLNSCKVAVSSCIFGSSDFLRRPTRSKVSAFSKSNVCFVMFLDESTLSQLASEGIAPDERENIGLWRIVLVRDLPYIDLRKSGKVPKFLSHRLFPSASYSIWIDSKMRLDVDPMLIIEYFMWRKGSEYAISNHYDRHCVWDEVMQNKRLNKYNHTAIDEQFLFYQSDGLVKFEDSGKDFPLLPSYVPEGSFIVRAHTPMSNLFSCLWFNEVDRFTSRDQLSFGYTFLKFRRMNPQKEFLLHMFKDCERRKVAKLFHHRGESPPIPHPQLSISERRSKLYERMSRDLEEHGAAFLEGGETSQSLSLSDLFSLKNGVVTPTLKPANPPVRANVLYLGSNYAAPLSQAVRDVFLPYFDGGIWFQNTSVYHFSMFHASHHLNPVPASRVEIEAEAKAVKGLTKELCPLKILLDRVVLTSTGVLLGCWQVMSGSDPSIIREKLERVLPLAPTKQLYDPVLLHTSFARLLGPPKTPTQGNLTLASQLLLISELVSRVDRKLRGFEAQVSELWYVEEMDILALALNGRMLVHRFDLGRCSRSLS